MASLCHSMGSGRGQEAVVAKNVEKRLRRKASDLRKAQAKINQLSTEKKKLEIEVKELREKLDNA